MNDTKKETKRTPDLTSETIHAAPGGELKGLSVVFRHGKELTLEFDQLTAEIQRQALLHGLKQKLVDAAAISRNPETGRTATIEDKYDAVKEVYDRLLAGEWNKRREGGGGTGGLLLQALVRLYPGKTREDLESFLAGKSRSEQAALRANPKVAAVIAEIQAERGAVDSDELLGELEGDDNE